ncbi:hypothetical protein OCU04_004665 [Sclerotinia nivalis]|uniref:Protein kinase domain-containing protein n=1 Tax=Sclerotinia nivalis TaxID=352851 RepID=A0A9X0AQW8_9HELO|nr:hypothetical protein OCU04_004665 [Sclerotinia nivalis]
MVLFNCFKNINIRLRKHVHSQPNTTEVATKGQLPIRFGRIETVSDIEGNSGVTITGAWSTSNSERPIISCDEPTQRTPQEFIEEPISIENIEQQWYGRIIPKISEPATTGYETDPALNAESLYRRKSDASTIPLSGSDATVLKNQLRDARLECHGSPHTFIIPICDQEILIKTETILRDIQYQYSDQSVALAAAKNAIKNANHLYAVLAYLKRGCEIFHFLQEGLSNSDLPFHRPPQQHGEKNHILVTKHGKHIKTFETWEAKKLENFYRYQWWMIAPVFRYNEHYYFEKEVVLPFLPFEPKEQEGDIPQSGSYGEVYPIRLHPSHHYFWSESSDCKDNGRLLAVKRLFSTDKAGFDKEVEMLKILGSKRHPHPHLIRLLGTFEKESHYHLIFPFASANLRKYWEDHDPNFDRTTVLWSLKQMAGIANALKQLHNFQATVSSLNGEESSEFTGQPLRVERGEPKYGRHGDLKPENLLWFEKGPGIDDENGILQIADFGKGKFHGMESKSRVRPSEAQASPTYEPPELRLSKPVSRAYDIWSLGGIYLEFITWLLLGPYGIGDFSNGRGKSNSIGVNDDTFFSIVREPSQEPDAEVRDSVLEWVAKLREHERCSKAIHELLDLTMEELLVADPQDRGDARKIDARFQNIRKKAEEDTDYLLSPRPRRRAPTVEPAHFDTDLPPSRPMSKTDGKRVSFSPEQSIVPPILEVQWRNESPHSLHSPHWRTAPQSYGTWKSA